MSTSPTCIKQFNKLQVGDVFFLTGLNKQTPVTWYRDEQFPIEALSTCIPTLVVVNSQKTTMIKDKNLLQQIANLGWPLNKLADYCVVTDKYFVLGDSAWKIVVLRK